MNTVQRLVYMANQIAANLAQEDDPARATADHIDKFWDPRMRAIMYEYRGEGLSPVAAAAIAQLHASA